MLSILCAGKEAKRARFLEVDLQYLTYKNCGQYLSSRMSHNNNTVIDVTLLLHLWSCHINHNNSATQMQPYRTDSRTDGQINPGWAG
jgi:hypothetical protein